MPNRKESAKRRKEHADDSMDSGLYNESPSRVFERLNLLQSAKSTDIVPILIEDLAPPDFYFPVSGTQVLAKLHGFNLAENGITHVWMRGIRPTDCEPGDSLLSEYICQNETRALILYPWASDGVLPLTKGKPNNKQLARFAHWSQELIWCGSGWGLKFAHENLRRFVVDYLVLEQLRHHLTNFSDSNKGDAKPAEELVEQQHAVIWSAGGIQIVK